MQATSQRSTGKGRHAGRVKIFKNYGGRVELGQKF